mgnify:CR=1 FL=1
MEVSKVISPNQILVSSFFGGPIAAIYFLRKNYIALGDDHYARNTLIYGVTLIIFVILLLAFLPEEIPNLILPLAYSLAAKQIAVSTQLEKHKIETSDMYAFESNIKIFGISIIALMIFMILAVLIFVILEAAGLISLADLPHQK